MTYITKVGALGNSAVTTIPLALTKLMHIEKGDKIKWTMDISDKGIKVDISVLEKEDDS